MKIRSNPSSLNDLSGRAAFIVLIFALAGCAHAPLRQSTTKLEFASIDELPPGVVPPRAVHTVAPRYPDAMISAGVAGDVWVRCWIDRNGALGDIVTVDALFQDFADAAREAVRQWRFAPGSRDGRPLGMWMDIPFHFTPRYPAASALTGR